MRCPDCGKPLQVRESRQIESGNYIRRRRICSDIACGRRVTSFEVIADTPMAGRTPIIIGKERFVELFRLLGAEFVDRLGLNDAFDILRARPPEPEPEPEPEALSASPSNVEE